MPAEQQSHFPETLQTENRLPTWSKLFVINTEELIFLVNNAGGYPKEIYKNIEHQAIKIWEWSEEQWDQIIKTNLRIPFLVTKNVVPVMIKQGKGDIVNVSSRMGRIASQMGAYAVAKGGIVTMTKTTAIQTKEYRNQMQCRISWNRGHTGTESLHHSVGQDGCPMGSSKDVAKAIIYLLADSPAVMTGPVCRPVHNSINLMNTKTTRDTVITGSVSCNPFLTPIHLFPWLSIISICSMFSEVMLIL